MFSNPITHPIRKTLENAEESSIIKGFLYFSFVLICCDLSYFDTFNDVKMMSDFFLNFGFFNHVGFLHQITNFFVFIGKFYKDLVGHKLNVSS